VEPVTEAFVRALPKAELHVHLEGSIEPALARRLAARHGVPVPPEPGPEGFADFMAFVRCYLAISRCLQDAEDFRDAAIELARRHAEQGVVQAEVTFTPITHVARGVAIDPILAGLVEGRAEAERVHGVRVRWVLDIVRTFHDQAWPTLEFARALERRDPGSVVGLGLGGPEAHAPSCIPLAPVFAAARGEGFHALPHAGEMAGAQSVREAVEHLGARRIGHGVRCLEDASLVAELVDRGVVLEVCPTSNVRLGVVPTLSDHPLPRLFEAGLAVTLGSDDPPLFGTDLVREYVACAEAFGWTRSFVRELAAASLDHACP
jgi:aminodeoxyfutalosine deaminase